MNNSFTVNLDIVIFAFFFFLFFSKRRFKNNGENFHIKLPVKNKLSQEVSVPEDLVQIQAYLRWERKGKQMYTPEQEKVSNEMVFHVLHLAASF